RGARPRRTATRRLVPPPPTARAARRTAPAGGDSASEGFGSGLSRGDRDQVAQGPEPGERLALELADPFPRQIELVADRLERPRPPLEAEPQLEDPPLALGQRLERAPDTLTTEGLFSLVERIGCLAVGEQVAELTLVVGADRLVERDGCVRGAERFVDVLH